MEAGNIPTFNTRYYAEKDKTVEQCASHGADHAAYKWSKKLDPRWNQEQVDAEFGTTEDEFAQKTGMMEIASVLGVI